MTKETRKPIIIGSKKGGGGGATEASDTLFARHNAAVLDVVSEGEIVGLVHGASSIFFNDTRIREKETLEYNFKGVETIERYGTQDQDIPKRFLSDFSTASVTQDFSGNGKLELNTPQYLKITTGSIERSLTDYLKVSIFTDAMYKVDKKGDNQGDTIGSTVSFDIDFIYTNDAGIQTVVAYRTGFNGKCSSKYTHTFGIDAEAYQPFKDWEIKVTRTAGEVSSPEYKVFNNIYCGIIESQITDKLEYPLTAYIGTKLDAEAFGTSIPKRAYDLKGVKISVPTNYFASDVAAKKITLADATNFVVGDSISSNFSISTITSDDAVNEGLTATATCASAHGIPVEQIWRTTISGVTVNSGTNYYNGTFDAVATTATKFTYQMSNDPDDDTGAGTMVGTAASGTVLSKSSNDVIVRDISNRFVLNSTVYDTTNHSGNSTTISAIADNPINFASYTRNVSTGAIETTDQDWDGNFYTSWTDNPAWVYYDLLTNKRYGLGNYINGDDVDKWELFSIAKYCDELVNDPTDSTGATTEPRFTCNLYLTKATEAYKVLQDLASIFRGMQYWINGTIVPVQDREKDPVYQFTDANVIGGTFEYEGSARKTRHNMAKVTYNNPDNFHKQTIEYVQDAELLAKEGSFPKIKNIAAFGCSSRGQALRLGKWLLTTEKLNYETVKFKTGLNASFLRPGDVINVLDARRQGVGWAGRVLKPTTSSQLVTNGTFGSGISSWTQGTATQAHDTSNKRIKLTSGGTAQTPRSYQSLGTLTANKTYRVKARAFCAQTMDNDQYATVSVTTATNATGDLTATGTYRTQSTTATFIDFTVTVGGSDATHYLQLEGVNLDDTENVSFDSIEVYQVNTTTSVRIDRDVVIASGKTYTLTLTKPGYVAKLAQDSATISSTAYTRGDILSSITTQEASQKVQDDSNDNVFVDWSPYIYSETKTVNTSAATVSTLGVSSAFSKVPDDETIWILQRTTTADELKAQQYTVLGIAEDGEDKFDITGLKYNASKFDFVDKREELETHRTINAPTGDHVIPPPTNLRIVPAAVKTAGTLTDLLSVAWEPPKVNTSGTYDATTTANNTIPYEFTKGYEIRFRTSDHEETDWQMLGIVIPPTISINQPYESTYNFQIRTVNMNNMMSTPLEGSFVVTPSSGVSKSEGVVSGVNLGGRIDNAIKLTTSNVTIGSTAPVVTNAIAVEKAAASDPGTLAFVGLSTDETGYVYWDYSAGTLTAKVTDLGNKTFYSIGGSEWTSIATDTVACTEGDADHVITGTNTTFTSDFTVGSLIRVDDEDEETYTIDTITSDTVLSVIEPIFKTQTTASIKKQSFVPDRVNDVILASVTEASGPAWSIVRHAQYTAEVIETGDIADNAVTTTIIAENAVTTESIATNSITSLLIATGAIGEVTIEANSITTVEIASNSITAALIAANSIDTAEITSGSIDTLHIGANQITTALIAANSIDTAEIVTGSIDQVHISANSIGQSQLQTDAVIAAHISANSIGTSEITSGAIVNASISANSINSSSITANSVNAVIIATDAVDTLQIVDDAVENAQIASNAVNQDSIAAGGVGTAEIAASAITQAKIAADAIGSAQIIADAVGAAAIAANAVGAAAIATNSIGTIAVIAGAIGTTEIAANAITSALIAANQIDSAEIAGGAIDSAHIGANQITTAKILAGNVTADQMGSGSITTAKIAAGNITTATIAAGAITTAKIAADQITSALIAANQIDSAELITGSIDSIHISSGAITTAKIGADQITTATINAGAVTADEVGTGAITTAKINADAITTAKIAANNITAAEISSTSSMNLSINNGDAGGWEISSTQLKTSDDKIIIDSDNKYILIAD